MVELSSTCMEEMSIKEGEALIWIWIKCKCGHRAWSHPVRTKFNEKPCLHHTKKQDISGYIYHSRPWPDIRGYCPCDDFEPAGKVKL